MQRFFLTLALVACGAGTGTGPSAKEASPAVEAWPPEDAASGIDDAAVADLFRREWMSELELDPEGATTLGVHRFDDRLEDNGPAGLQRSRAIGHAFLAEGRALLARADLGPADRTSLELLVEHLDANVASEVCAFEEWSLSASENPLTRWNRLPEDHVVTTPESGRALLARYARIPGHVDQEVANLRRGLARGLVSNAESIRRVSDMFEKQLAQPVAADPMLGPLRAAHDDWPPAELAHFRSELERLVAEQIRPALSRYLGLLEGELVAAARGDDKPGLAHLPIGAACYRARARAHTTLGLEPAELHATGLRLIEALDREIAALGQQALQSRDLADTLARLRDDRSLYFSSAEELEQKAKSSLDRARAALPRAFGVLPEADCVVSRIPDYEAPYSTIAYYRQPVPDGSRPGEYFVNVFRPETRPRFEAAVLAFHESIPGHHVQIAIAQELRAVPAFRKHVAPSSFVEGWALYTERLADELGLYESALDRLGMLSFDAWRASRLVVDTGLHALGWTRQQAIDFMLAHTALAPNNIDNEVDRYIVWPGQALAYKVGQLEILQLRQHARERLGDRFDLHAFHDAVLLGGGVSLPVLRGQIEAYIERGGAKAN